MSEWYYSFNYEKFEKRLNQEAETTAKKLSAAIDRGKGLEPDLIKKKLSAKNPESELKELISAEDWYTKKNKSKHQLYDNLTMLFFGDSALKKSIDARLEEEIYIKPRLIISLKPQKEIINPFTGEPMPADSPRLQSVAEKLGVELDALRFVEHRRYRSKIPTYDQAVDNAFHKRLDYSLGFHTSTELGTMLQEAIELEKALKKKKKNADAKELHEHFIAPLSEIADEKTGLCCISSESW